MIFKRTLSILIIVLLWESLAIVTDPIYFVSLPEAFLSLIEAFKQDSLLTDILASLRRVSLALLAVFIIAIPLGVSIGSSKKINLSTEPITRFLRYIPAPTIIPLSVIWFGTGELSKIFIVFWGVFFPVLLGIRDAAKATPKEYIECAQSLNYSEFKIMKDVIFENIKPDTLNLLRIAFAESWIYLLMAEMIASPNGIGKALILAQRYLRVDKIFGILILLAIIGLVSELLFQILRKLLFRYKND